MQYVATINVPGYLPMDDDPPVFDSPSEAWGWLAEERRDAEEAIDRGTEAVPYSETVSELDARASAAADNVPQIWTGTIYGDTPGYDGKHDLGLAYSVSVAEEP